MTGRGSNHADRRSLLAGIAGAIGAFPLAGCLGSSVPDPVAVPSDRVCDTCGMLIHDHPGPIGQVFFEDESAVEPAQFCSSTCTYEYRFVATDEGRTPTVIYLTDYSSVDFEVYEEGGDRFITAHPAVSAFAPTGDLSVVARSEVLGSMGPDLHPFGDEGAADTFAADYGGDVLSATAVSEDLLDAL